MRVESFKVTNYRSIESAEVPLHRMTSLVGANNEGKSNILRALVLAMDQLLGGYAGERRTRERNRRLGLVFDPTRDAPYAKPDAVPRVEIRLWLDEVECDEFLAEVGHRINGHLRFRIDFPPTRRPTVKVVKQRSGPTLTDKSDQIAGFVRRRLRLEYIPSIRTAQQAVDVVRRLVFDQLAVLRKDATYAEALERISALEQPLLDEIASDVQASLSEFLPDVVGVTIESGDRAGVHRPLRDILEIEVDDGVPTDLSMKGDGVQSLAAIALMRRAATVGNEDGRLILAVEEPETHLHPSAVRRLRAVLREISQEQQVVLATHSPLLIDTESPAANVVVRNNNAEPARSVADIRDCLGVEISDNLSSARLVLLVEGANDRRVVRSVLSALSASMAELLDAGELAVESLEGATRLSAHASSMRASACSVFAVLDGDSEGGLAVRKAVDSGRIAASDYRLVTRSNLSEAEIEDLFLMQRLAPILDRHFGVSLNVGSFGKGGPKWSSKLASQLTRQGKLADATEMGTAKRLVAEAVESDPTECLRREGRIWFEELAASLQERLL